MECCWLSTSKKKKIRFSLFFACQLIAQRHKYDWMWNKALMTDWNVSQKKITTKMKCWMHDILWDWNRFWREMANIWKAGDGERERERWERGRKNGVLIKMCRQSTHTHIHRIQLLIQIDWIFFLAPVCADAVARERFTCNMLTMIFSVRCIIFSMVATVATAIVIAMFVRLLISLQIIVYQSSA